MAKKVLTIKNIRQESERILGGDVQIAMAIDASGTRPLSLVFKGVTTQTIIQDYDLSMSIEEFSARILQPMADNIKKRLSAYLPYHIAPETIRGSTHGDYTNMSRIAQDVKTALKSGKNWDVMAPHCRETLELMATKMARIVEGDFSHYDHWDDLRGYPQLVLDRMARLPTQTDQKDTRRDTWNQFFQNQGKVVPDHDKAQDDSHSTSQVDEQGD